jgi:hypothetical protein
MYDTEQGTIKLKCPREQEYVSYTHAVIKHSYPNMCIYSMFLDILYMIPILPTNHFKQLESQFILFMPWVLHCKFYYFMFFRGLTF